MLERQSIKCDNFVKVYLQDYQYESKIYFYTTYWTIILFLQQIYRLKGACPVWWHTAPMPVLSFLKRSGYDFNGKIVVPFCSYANMFPHETLLEIVNATPNSLHPNGFISEEGDTTGIVQWLDDINLKLK